MPRTSESKVRRHQRVRRFPRLKATRLVLLALGVTALFLGAVLYVFARRSGIERCLDYAYMYALTGIVLLAARWVLAWLKRRQKQRVRRQRRERAAASSSQVSP